MPVRAALSWSYKSVGIYAPTHPGGPVVVDSSNDKGRCAMARSVPRRFPVKVKLVRPKFLVAVLATGIVVSASASLLFLVGGVADSRYYRLPSLAAGRSAPCAEMKEVELWWARPPSKSAWHNMSDEELLCAASFQPLAAPLQRSSTPKKVAFLFLTRGPLPLAPLWERFFNGTGGSDVELFSVYVHTKPGYIPDFPPSSPFHGRQVPSKATEWGMPSVVDAERRLLANALLDLDNVRFVLVSESCIPLHPLPVVHAYLTHSVHSFVSVFDEPGRDGKERYPAGLAPDVSILQWRKGWQWFELHRSLAMFVVAESRYYPRFREMCLPRCYVDEHYLPTVLTIEAPGSVANRSVTWVDWTHRGEHPTSFGAEDVVDFFLKRLTGKKEMCTYNGQPKDICFLFARKFTPDALRPLLELSTWTLGY